MMIIRCFYHILRASSKVADGASGMLLAFLLFSVIADQNVNAASVPTGIFAGQSGSFIGMSGDGDGFIQLNLTGTGKFTSQVTLNGITHSMKGTLDANGDFSGFVSKETIPVDIHLDVSEGNTNVGDSFLTISTAEKIWSARHTAYNAGQTAVEAGKYTVMFLAGEWEDSIPQGTGYATMTVSDSGAVTMKGKLADGTAFTASGPLTGGDDGNEFIVYNSKIYGKKGLLAGRMIFASITESDCNGVLQWLKPMQEKGSYYKAGFDTDLNAYGARYTGPPRGTMALDFPVGSDNGIALLSHGGLDLPGGPYLIDKTVTLTTLNTIVVSGSNVEKLNFKINDSTGSFSGSFVHPVNKKNTSFAGVLYQNAVYPLAGGFFLGPVIGDSGYSGDVFMFPNVDYYSINLSSAPDAGGMVDGDGEFPYGFSQTINATANNGYTFVNWTEEGDVVSSLSSYTFTVTENRTMVANFTLDPGYNTISLSASPAEGGAVSGAGAFVNGSTCEVTATANEGYTFVNWTEDGIVVSASSNYNFTLSGNRILVANFTVAPGYDTISLSASPPEGGAVSGAGVFANGSSCEITAIANNGYAFVNWTEDGVVISSSASHTFTLTESRTLVANFNIVNYTIAVSASPGAGGAVGGGGTFAYGSSRTVTATANSGYTFTNWTQGGVVVSSSASYTFTLYGNRTLVANFNPVSYTIAVTASPGAGGAVGGGGAFAYGSSRTVTATANSGYTFTNWTDGGVVVSSSTSYTFTLSGNRTLVANFAQNQANYTIAVSASPAAGGNVGGSGTFANGSSRTVTATANSGYTFTNWTEGGVIVSTSASYTFTLNKSRTLVANFVSGSNVYDGTYSGSGMTVSPFGTAMSSGTFTVVNGRFTDPAGFFTGEVEANGNFKDGKWEYSQGSLPIPMTGQFSTSSSFVLSGNIGSTVIGTFTLQKQ